MSKDIYCDAKILIDDIEIPYIQSVTTSFSGDNKLNYLNVTFNISDIEAYSLYNKRVQFFLNESGPESTPYFTGYIMDVSPQPKSGKCSIKALDPRCFLTGAESKKISVTENNNFDGYTLVQFIKEMVDMNLGENGYPSNSLGTELLSETTLPILMKGVRDSAADIYSIFLDKITEATNDSDIEDVKGYFIDIVETDNVPQITVKEKKNIDENASLNLSYMDGLISVSYNKRAIPSYGIARSQSSEGKEIVGEFQDGNMPLGYRAVVIEGEYRDPDAAKYKALTEVYKNKEDMEIKVKANKGFKTPLGSIVYLDVDDLKIRGNHIIVKKSCNWNTKGVSLSITLGRASPTVSEYI